MSAHLERLRELLGESRSDAAQRICAQPPKPLRKGDFAKIESLILSSMEPEDNLAALIEAVRRAAIKAHTKRKVLDESRIVIHYPAPKNPFAAKGNESPLSDAQQEFHSATKWLSKAHRAKTPALAFYRFLLSAILDFRLLHQDYIPAILRSLRKGREIKLTNRARAIPLSLSYGRQPNAERRLLILRDAALRTYLKFLGTHGAKDFFESLGERATESGVTTEQFLRELARIVEAEAEQHGKRATVAKTGRPVQLPPPPPVSKLIESARTLAMLDLPSVVVAHRSRQIVSHSLPPEVLNRLAGFDLQLFGLPERPIRACQGPDGLEPPATYRDPPWMVRLRKALNVDGLNHRILNNLARMEEMAPQLLAQFAQYLAEGTAYSSRKKKKKKTAKNKNGLEPGTVRRYCLLIAVKLIPRLNATPVEEMTHDSWEDAIEQLLDEDAFYNLEAYSANPKSSAQLHSRPLVTAIRYWLLFLDKKWAHRKPPLHLAEIEKQLPVLGLVAVDASLITVDEYRLALERMVGGFGPDDEDELEAGRVALILGYRCGLRRSEAAGLAVSDIDSIDYLHVRANEMRSLKTSNAKRDLPLRLLMPEDEIEHVHRRINQVRERADSVGISPDKAYIFSKAESPGKLIDFEEVVARIHRAFRGDARRGWEPLDPTFHYHRLRHSFCNLTLLKLWPALGEMAAAFLRGKENQLTRQWIQPGNFRQELFGTECVVEGDLQAVALLMGHGSAAVSLEHYTHVLDFYEPPLRRKK
jgi:integrase